MTTEEPIGPSPFSNPKNALSLARKAPSVLSKTSSIATTFPLNLLSAPESPELWMEVASLFYACLRTGDDKSAHLALEKLTQRFGEDNDRVMGMRGLYQEAVAQNEDELRKILGEYNKILGERPVCVPIMKRRIALVKSLGREAEAIEALVDFLGSFPTDVEAWCELGELYMGQGMGLQAIYCLEEALLTIPNAWNLHAKLGELEYMVATAGEGTSEAAQQGLGRAVQRFSRSIELCDDYLRAYYGLNLAVGKLLATSKQGKTEVIAREKLQRLDRLATERLKAIVAARHAQAGEKDEAEIIAAQALLDKTSS
jgi:ER membrane protein complex subunit 2